MTSSSKTRTAFVSSVQSSTRRYTPALIILVYGVFVVWLTWPAITHLGTAIPGLDRDAFVHLWTFDWIKDCVTSWQWPFFTQRLFYPDGVALYTHNFAWMNIVLWLPLQAIVGSSAAYSLTFLTVHIFNGIATYVLVRHLTRSELAAFVAGFIAAGWQYTITRYSQPNLIFTAFVPLALLALHHLARSGRWRGVWWVGIAVAGIGISRYQLLIMSSPFLGICALFWLWQIEPAQRRQYLVQLIAAASLAAILLAPFAGPVVWYQATRAHPEDLIPVETQWGDADLLGFFLPQPHQPIVGPMFAAQSNNLPTHYPIGVAVLALMAIGLIRSDREKWLWPVLAGLIMLLALGRTLTINGRTYFTLPFAWLENSLFVVQLVRYPSRFSALLAIPVSIMAGYGVLALEERFDRRLAWAAVAAFTLIIAAEYRTPDYPLLSVDVPDWYQAIGQDREQYGIITVPLDRTFDEFYMHHQLTHRKPIVEGHVSRPPREAFQFIESVPFLVHLRDAKLTPSTEINDISRQLRRLHDHNFRYVVIHKPFLAPQQVSDWRLWFGFSSHHEDNDVLVYSTAPQPGQDYRTDKVGAPGLRFMRGHVIPATVVPGARVTTVSHWGAAPSAEHDWTACYRLSDASGQIAQATCKPLSLPIVEGMEEQIMRAGHDIQLNPELAVGSYQVVLELQQGGGLVADPVSLGRLYVQSGEQEFTAPKPQTTLQVQFGRQLALIGYDGPMVTNQSIQLTLFWHAQEQIEKSYKFFIHLIDAETNTLATQLDYVPRDWNYPTDSWQTGEYVIDRLSLPLAQLEPGAYHVNIGVYDPQTGDRLPATTPDNESFADNSVPLTTITLSGS